MLKHKGGLTKNYAQFAAGNLTPAANYPEGAEYATPRVRGAKKLSRRKRAKRFGTKIDHLSSASYLYKPGKGLGGKKWKLALRSPARPSARRRRPWWSCTAPTASARSSASSSTAAATGARRSASTSARWRAVSVTLVNASTRYRCGKRTVLACRGRPLDDKSRFSVKGHVVKR